MDVSKWITLIVLGGTLGALGQGVRSVVGLKKLRDSVGDDGAAYSEEFSPSRLIVSIFIGFVAGALTALMFSDQLQDMKASKELLLSLMAAGYAGADSIEGLANKFLPKVDARGTRIA